MLFFPWEPLHRRRFGTLSSNPFEFSNFSMLIEYSSLLTMLTLVLVHKLAVDLLLSHIQAPPLWNAGALTTASLLGRR